jgi:hypothetical protein
LLHAFEATRCGELAVKSKNAKPLRLSRNETAVRSQDDGVRAERWAGDAAHKITLWLIMRAREEFEGLAALGPSVLARS